MGLSSCVPKKYILLRNYYSFYLELLIQPGWIVLLWTVEPQQSCLPLQSPSCLKRSLGGRLENQITSVCYQGVVSHANASNPRALTFPLLSLSFKGQFLKLLFGEKSKQTRFPPPFPPSAASDAQAACGQTLFCCWGHIVFGMKAGIIQKSHQVQCALCQNPCATGGWH